MNSKVNLHVIQGGSSKQINIDGTLVATGVKTSPPFPIEVKIFEEDTYLVLTVDRSIKTPLEHPIRLMTSLHNEKPRVPGSVIRNKNSWYAVVHNLDHQTTCQEQWVINAYNEIFRLAEKYKITSLGVPLLGSVYGTIPRIRSMKLLLSTIQKHKLNNVRQVWIIVPDTFFVKSKQILNMHERKKAS